MNCSKYEQKVLKQEIVVGKSGLIDISIAIATILTIVSIVISIMAIMYLVFPELITPTNDYVETAVKALSSKEIYKPIKELTEYSSNNKMIYYGDDILVQIAFEKASLDSSSLNRYTVTYSINRNEFITQNELDYMMYTSEWKNAKIEDINGNQMKKMNNKYFK